MNILWKCPIKIKTIYFFLIIIKHILIKKSRNNLKINYSKKNINGSLTVWNKFDLLNVALLNVIL